MAGLLDAHCRGHILKGTTDFGLAIEDDAAVDIGASRARIEPDRLIEIREGTIKIAVVQGVGGGLVTTFTSVQTALK